MTLARKLGIAALIIYTLVVTVLRAFRTPNDFAEGHWLLDYRFGFVKRGLIGEIVSLVMGLLSIPVTEQLISTLAIAVFLIFCTVLVAVAIRIVRGSGWSTGAVLVTLVFLSSPFAVMSAHLVGYYDNIVIILGIFSVLLLIKGRPWLGACLFIPSLLTHENALVLAFVPFCLAWLLINSRRQKLGIPRLSFLPVLLPVCMFVAVTVNQEMFMTENFRESAKAYLSQFPFIEWNRDRVVSDAFSTSLLSYYSLFAPEFPSKIFAIDMHGLILPTTLAILFYLVSVHKIPELSIELLVLLGVCFAPQLLQLVAADTPRIWTYTIVCAFLALWIYAETTPTHEDSSANRLLCLVILIANVVILTPLMDAQSDHFSLRTRFFLYTPVIAGSVALILFGGKSALADRFSIQGSTIPQLLLLTTRHEPTSTPATWTEREAPER